jgi:hypothetical protein
MKDSGYEMTQLKYKCGWVYADPIIFIELLNIRGNATTEFLIIWRHTIMIWSFDNEVLKRGTSTREKSRWVYPTQCRVGNSWKKREWVCDDPTQYKC